MSESVFLRFQVMIYDDFRRNQGMTELVSKLLRYINQLENINPESPSLKYSAHLSCSLFKFYPEPFAILQFDHDNRNQSAPPIVSSDGNGDF